MIDKKSKKRLAPPTFSGVVSCKICGITFSNKWKLGGHVSAKHSGESEAYNFKRKRFEERKTQRAILSAARNIYYKLHPAKDHRQDYKTLNEYKKKVKMLLPDDEPTDQQVSTAENKVFATLK